MISSIYTEEVSSKENSANDKANVDPTLPKGEQVVNREQEDLSKGNMLDSPENIRLLKSMAFDTKQSFTKEDLKTTLEKVFLKKEFGPEELGYFQNMITKMLHEVPEMKEMLKEEFVSYFAMENLMKFIEQNKAVTAEDSEKPDMVLGENENAKTEM